MGRIGMRVRSAMLSKVFHKSLCLSQRARSLPKYSVGKLNNLMSVSTPSFHPSCVILACAAAPVVWRFCPNPFACSP